MARSLLILFVAWATLLAGCASNPSPDNDSLEPASQTTVVQVDNRGYLDMTVYVLDGGQRVRLGQAKGNGVTELVIPRHLVGRGGQLRFLCDPIGSSRTPVSDEITVEPGDHVTLMIPSS